MQQCIGSDLRSSQRTLYHRWLTSYREECYYLKCIVYGILRYSAVRRLLNTRLHIVYYITMGPGCQGHAPTSTLRYDRFLEINPRDWSCDLSVELPESKVVNFDGFFSASSPANSYVHREAYPGVYTNLSIHAFGAMQTTSPYTIQCTAYTIQCTAYTIQCNAYIIQYTLPQSTHHQERPHTSLHLKCTACHRLKLCPT